MNKFLLTIVILFNNYAFAFNEQPYNKGYFPERDPFADFELAQVDAQPEDKLILLVLGGDWCGWCHKLSSFIKKNDEVREYWDSTFVTMKVNVSEENYNDEFLSYLPEHKGYPYFVIVSSDGDILGAQNTGSLEGFWGYSEDELNAFISQWQNRSE